MASIGKDKNGRKRILFVAEDKSRKTIRLGKTSIKQAEAFKIKLEAVIAARYTRSMDAETARWVAALPDDVHAKLVKVGLVEPRQDAEQKKFTVGEWVARYIDSRTDVKPTTSERWHDAEHKLARYFKDKLLTDVTAQDGMSYRIWLKSDCNLAENTVRKMIGLARQFWNAAITAKLVTENPFIGRGQPVTVRANSSRFFYVTREITRAVLEACPDVEWRLIFGMARWGGLRCPSEVLTLKWQDVDFEHKRFIVRSSKTEHHANSGIRTVPMFPELGPLFQDAFDQAETGDVYCVTRHRGRSENFHYWFETIIRRAGLEPWPKLFQNCRSTRETELFKITGGNVKAVCSWIGNTPQVAMEHYAQVTEADMREAALVEVMDDAEKAAHNPAQYPAVNGSKPPQSAKSKEPKTAFTGPKPAFSDVRQVRGVVAAGRCSAYQNGVIPASQDYAMIVTFSES